MSGRMGVCFKGDKQRGRPGHRYKNKRLGAGNPSDGGDDFFRT